MASRQDFRTRLIELTVHAVFCDRTFETYNGLVTTGEVLKAVRKTLQEFGFSMDLRAIGETLDQIRLQGPTGENDHKWFGAWCGELPVSPPAIGIR